MKKVKKVKDLKELLDAQLEMAAAVANGEIDPKRANSTKNLWGGALASIREKRRRITETKSTETIHFVDDVQL